MTRVVSKHSSHGSAQEWYFSQRK